MSDISSICGPSTLSVISSVSSADRHAANSTITIDPSVLSPYLRKFAEKVTFLESRKNFW
jgi:hypothetical protein